MVYDEEFGELVAEALRGHARATSPGRRRCGRATLDDLIARRRSTPPRPAGPRRDPHQRHDRHAEGRRAQHPSSLDPAAALLDMIPLRARERTMIAAPMFHSWGLAHFMLGLTLSARRSCCGASSTPLRRCARSTSTACTALIVVPVMLAAPPRTPSARAPPSTTCRACGSSPRAARRCPAHLANAVMDDVRRRPLQPLRLDRGRVGDDRDARGPARRAGHGRAPAARHDPAPLRRGGPAGRRAEASAASSSATRCSSTATPAAAARTSSTA